MDVLAGLRELAPVLVFLIAVTVLAQLLDRAGVFEQAAHGAAVLGRGSTRRLYGLIVLLAVATTVLLGLDTTAVLLTPVVLALCRSAGLPAAPFALVVLLLANTGSLLLPVSNLTNLLAARRLHLAAADYAWLLWRPALLAVAVTVLGCLLLDRRELAGRYERPVRPALRGRGLPLACGGVLLSAVVALLAGTDPAVAVTVAAVLVGLLFALRAPEGLRAVRPPWALVAGVALLVGVVAAAGPYGLDAALGRALGADPGTLRLAVLGALGSNAVDNLPTYLALERVVAPGDLPAVLVGVDAGPLLTPWASLATLLWAQQCRAAGVVVPWRALVLRGVLLLPPVLLGALLV